jgi:hypothetical protein
MRQWLRRIGIVLLLLVIYLLVWPVPIRPVAWQAPSFAGYAGAHARNERLGNLRLVSVAPHVGPEHIAFGPDGKLYTGVLDGAVLRMNPDGTGIETFVETGGRPLGLDFDAGGRLIIADALRGLLAVQPDGSVAVLADSIALDPIRYADAVKVASDGKILFTDASTRLSPREYGTFDAALLDILEHSCSGRVAEFDPSTSATRIIAVGLCFPNGVELSADETSLLVAETGSYRILRISRDANVLDVGAELARGGAQARVLLDNLPGKPFLREVILRLPKFLWPVPPVYPHVIAFDENGSILADLQDPAGRLPETSGATEHQGMLYVQSLHASALGILPFSPGAGPPRSP